MGTQAVISQPKPTLYDNYLQKEYGISSIEELQVKYEQEAYENYTRYFDELYTNQSEWWNEYAKWQSTIPQYGTSTYKPEIPQGQIVWWRIFESYNSFVQLSVISLSGLGFLAMTFIPFVKHRKRLKYALVLTFICLIFFSIGFFAGQTYTQSLGRGIWLDDLPSTASYVINTDGTYCWATRYDGKIVYGGSNNVGGVNGTVPADVIIALKEAIELSSLPDRPIFVKAGEYNITKQLLFDKCAGLIAERGTIFHAKLDDYMIKFSSDPYRRHILHNVDIVSDDSGYSPKGIFVQGAEYLDFYNVHCYGDYLTYGLTLNSVVRGIFELCEFNANTNGLFVKFGWKAGFYGVNLLHFLDCSFHSPVTCVKYEQDNPNGYWMNHVFENCDFVGSTPRIQLISYAPGGGTSFAPLITFHSAWFEGGGIGIRYVVDFDNGGLGGRLIWLGQNFIPSGWTPWDVESGITVKVLGKISNSTFESTGTESIPEGETSIEILHGLTMGGKAITPDAADIKITPLNNPTNDIGGFWISNIDSSTFTLNIRNEPGASGFNFAYDIRTYR